jgi:hypothetical protein
MELAELDTKKMPLINGTCKVFESYTQVDIWLSIISFSVQKKSALEVVISRHPVAMSSLG